MAMDCFGRKVSATDYGRLDRGQVVYDCVRCRMSSHLVQIDLSRVVVGGEFHDMDEGFICVDREACLARCRNARRQMKLYDRPQPRLRIIQGGRGSARCRTRVED